MKNKKMALTIIGMLFIFIIVLFISFYIFSMNIAEITAKTVSSRLIENTKNNVVALDTMFKKDINFLESIAAGIVEKKDLDDKKIFELLNTFSQYSSFMNFAIDLPDGTSRISNGLILDVGKMEYLKRVLDGEAAIAQVVHEQLNDSPCITVAVPIFKDDKVVGALRGIYDTNDFFDMLSVNIFDGNGSFSLVERNGNKVFNVADESIKSNFDNIFTSLQDNDFNYDYSLEDIMNDFKRESSNFTVFNVASQDLFVYYTPMSVGDWYAISAIPIEYINADRIEISNSVWILIWILVILFVLVLIYIIYYTRSTKKIIVLEREYLENILNSIEMPIFISTNDKIIQYVNDALVNMFNKKREDLINKPCYLLNTCACCTHNCSIEKFNNCGNSINYIPYNNGYYQINSVKLKNENGSEVGFIEVFQDISEIIGVQNALEEKTIELETVSENIAGGLIITKTNKDLQIIKYNGSFSKLIMADDDDILYECSFLNWIPVEEIDNFSKEISAQLQSNKYITLEHRLKRNDGKIIWISLNGKKAFINSEEVCVWMLTDITVLKETTQKLKISEELYRVATLNTNDTIVDYNIINKTITNTSKTAQLYGISEVVENGAEGVIECNIIGKAYIDEFREIFNKIDNGEEKVSCTIQTISKKGDIMWTEIIFTALYDDDNRPVRAIGIIKDITSEYVQRKKYERAERFRNITSRDTLYSYEVNVTKKKFTVGHDLICSKFGFELTDDYAAIAKIIVDNFVYCEDKKMVDSYLKIENIEESYQKGINKLNFEYRRVSEKNSEPLWVECTIYLYEETEEEGFICGYAFAKDINEVKKHELALRQRAELDLLTGVYNKVTFETYVREFLSNNDNGVFMIIDLDNFKNINDTLGHVYGDIVLSEVARQLTIMFSKNSIIGRIGGDEFVVFIKNLADYKLINSYAESICDMFHNSYTGSNNNYKISGTIGIANFPEHGDNFDTLYKRADIALYNAKKRGKDTYGIYHIGLKDENSSILNKDIDINAGKVFSENIAEYILRILFESSDHNYALNSVLEIISRHFNFSRGYVFEINDDETSWCNTFEWCASKITPQIENLQDIKVNIIGDYSRFYDENGIFIVRDVPKVDKSIRQILTSQDIKSLIQVGFYKDNKLHSFIGFDDCINFRDFKPEEISTLKYVSTLIGTYLLTQEAIVGDYISTKEMEMVLDSINNFIYVINKNDYKLQYINAKTSRLIPTVNIGDLCHKVLRNNDKPCIDCPIIGLRQCKDNKFSTKIHNTEYDILVDVTASNIIWNNDRDCVLLNCNDLS